MKKLTLAMAFLAVSILPAMAQETESFQPGAFIQLQVGAAHDLGEAPFVQLISPAAQAAFGYRFNEVFGARLSVNGLQAKNHSVSDNPYLYRFVQPSLDLQFDLASLFKGWESRRTFNPYWFFGGGAAIGLDNQGAIDLARGGDKFSLLWEPTKLFWAARTGLGADIRITSRLAFNLELNANMYPDTFNSKKAINNPVSPDFRFNALAGFTLNFGKKAPKARPVVVPAPKVYQPETQPAPSVKEPEPAPVVKEEPVIVKEEPAAPVIEQGADVDIFFDLKKAVIRDDQIMTLNRLVSFLRNTPAAKVKLDGYADKQTGNAEINQELSEQRVIAVRQYLVSRGIDPSRISTAAHGDKVQPFTGEKNRAVTCRIR